MGAILERGTNKVYPGTSNINFKGDDEGKTQFLHLRTQIDEQTVSHFEVHVRQIKR